MLKSGTCIGPFEIQSPIGEGGMGVVYRAHDTKLKRDVALKALPEPFALDAERLSRFQREAQALASLNHPNIAQIYGLEESGNVRCIVMELVAGETLHEQVQRGPVPLDEALDIAKQIVDGLETAHERGIIHRDLKPANIKRTPDGRVKILDFGLARMFDSRAGNADVSNSPTMMSATGAGMILGTAAYMSPEQARGREAGVRSDIWAFGAVLYELLTGRQAFQGETVTDLLASVIKSEPDWSALPASTPEPIRLLVRQCLQKDSRRRLQHIGDARIFLEEMKVEMKAGFAPAGAASPVPRSRERSAWILITAALSVALAFVAVSSLRRAPAEAAAVRFTISPPENTQFSRSFGFQAVSPDGTKLAFSATDNQGRRMLWVRPLDSLTAQPIAGTENAGAPFWSGDGRSVGFAIKGQLKRVELSGGASQTIGSLSSFSGATWNHNGVIIFGTEDGPLQRVAAAGGTPLAVTELDKSQNERFHGSPMFLPDGEHFLYATGNNLLVGSLESKERQILMDSGRCPCGYTDPGYLLFLRGSTLMAASFDAARLRVTSDAFVVAAELEGAFSASTNGVLSYRSTSGGAYKLTWFDRSGKELGVEPVPGPMQAPNLSQDGKRVALQISSGEGKNDISILDLVRGTNMRVTLDGNSARPFFSPDGNRLVFVREGNIYMKSASGTGAEEMLEKGEPTDWSPDGNYVFFIRGGDLWSLSIKDRMATRVVTGKGNDRRGRFSPDGKWFAYESDESGRFEIYVQKFPPSGERIQVSANGGNSAWWRSDGKELFFNTLERKLMSVDIRPGNAFDASPPKMLFEIPGEINNGRFIATPDGQRFLMPLQRVDDSQSLNVIVNWPATIKK